MRVRKFPVAAALAGLAAAAAAIALAWPQLSGEVKPAAAHAKSAPAAAPGGPFSLVDHSGKRVSDQTYRGSFLLVFFGYVSCPDFCPTMLYAIAHTMDLLGGNAARVRPLFVSVDPERDTPELLAGYVAAFGHGIVGLTGTSDEIRRVADAYRVYFAKAGTASPGNGDPSHYSVDHSAFTYLMGPDGRYLTHFAYGASPETMAKEILRHLERRGN